MKPWSLGPLIKSLGKARPTKRPPSKAAALLDKIFKALVLECLGAFIVWRIFLGFEIHHQLAAIRNAGLPSSPPELNQWYKAVPEDQNAALILTNAFATLTTFPDLRAKTIDSKEILDRREPWSKEIRSNVVAYVEMNHAAMEKAQEGLKRSECRYPIDLSYGLETSNPHLESLKKLGTVGALQAILAAEKAQKEECAANIGFILKLARTLDTEPQLISEMVRGSLISTAAKTLEHCLNLCPLDNSTEEMNRLFKELSETNILKRALIGERASCAYAFRLSWAEVQQLGTNGEPRTSTATSMPLMGHPNPGLWITGLFERELNYFLRGMDSNIVLAGLPLPSVRLAERSALQHKNSAPERFLEAPLFLSAMDRTFGYVALAVTRARLSTTANAVEQFSKEQGRAPLNLSELVPSLLPSVPIDPFDGKSLRYRKLPKGYLIYSVGNDGKDDGGLERPLHQSSRERSNADLTFTVER